MNTNAPIDIHPEFENLNLEKVVASVDSCTRIENQQLIANIAFASAAMSSQK